jgi:hypothetical protein
MWVDGLLKIHYIGVWKYVKTNKRCQKHKLVIDLESQLKICFRQKRKERTNLFSFDED